MKRNGAYKGLNWLSMKNCLNRLCTQRSFPASILTKFFRLSANNTFRIDFGSKPSQPYALTIWEAEISIYMNWPCDYCRSINQIESIEILKKDLQICDNCGLAFPTERVLSLISGSYQYMPEQWDCYPIEDLATRVPRGPNGIFWEDPTGKLFSRQDYISVHKIDPKIYFEYRNGREGYRRE